MTPACLPPIAVQLPTTSDVRLIPILFLGLQEHPASTVGRMFVSVCTTAENYRLQSYFRIRLNSQGSMRLCPMWGCMAPLVPAGIPCRAHPSMTNVHQMQIGPSVNSIGANFHGVMCRRAASRVIHPLFSMALIWHTIVTTPVAMPQTATMILRQTPGVHTTLTCLESTHYTRGRAVNVSMQEKSCHQMC